MDCVIFIICVLSVRLRDACTLVRKNTIMVLTHLILNDMIKIRGQIRLMALCLEDEENDIREMAHMFFHELSLKVCLQDEYILYISLSMLVLPILV